MRWVAIIFILAAIIATGWFILRLGPAQPFLRVPVPSSEPDNSSTDLTVSDTPDSGESEPETEPELETEPEPEPEPSGDDVTEPDPSIPELPPATDPDPNPVSDPVTDPAPTPPLLEGDAALAQYRTWISEARAAHPYPETEQLMYDVMMCESGGQADIVNPAGPYTGLFQYADGTWNGEWNTYRDSDATDARAQIYATALAWSLNMQGQWGCYSRAH